MAKSILPYKVNNSLSGLIEQKAKEQRKGIRKIEEELAEYCGLKRITISKYKTNKTDDATPSLPVAIKICKYFGTSVEKVFELKEI